MSGNGNDDTVDVNAGLYVDVNLKARVISTVSYQQAIDWLVEWHNGNGPVSYITISMVADLFKTRADKVIGDINKTAAARYKLTHKSELISCV